jgi:uncharacterized damage-inducible protein DinB
VPHDLTTEIGRVLQRELASLRRELEAYPDEDLIWHVPQGAPNSAGTLALHLAGNIQHYVGAILGGTGYVRDRHAEFATRDLSRGSLLDHVAAAEEAVRSVLPAVTDASLSDSFPEAMRGVTLSRCQALLHLATHLAYHVGQVDYHRRLVTKDPAGIDAISPVRLVPPADSSDGVGAP